VFKKRTLYLSLRPGLSHIRVYVRTHVCALCAQNGAQYGKHHIVAKTFRQFVCAALILEQQESVLIHFRRPYTSMQTDFCAVLLSDNIAHGTIRFLPKRRKLHIDVKRFRFSTHAEKSIISSDGCPCPSTNRVPPCERPIRSPCPTTEARHCQSAQVACSSCP